MKGILGRKIGMTQVFTKSGKLIPVTVVEVEPNVVTQIKTVENDGYDAIQLGFDTKKEKNSTKANIGHAKKAETAPKRFYKEIRGVNVSDYTLGQELTVELFNEGEVVDVTGTTKGKGFQGVIKRHNQSRGPMGHGSQYHRGPGSMGTMRPMRVFKGKKLPGHMGGLTVTIQNLEIVAVDKENNVLLVKGNVPGANKSLVIIKTAVKNPNKVNEREELISYVTEPEVKEEVETTEVTENTEDTASTEENE
ncbi:MAG TPA: 50S ribosomal protein L3 [Candidatus Pelethosoma merdigallinarum]|nr:50S ribosomal protein L3 [Candidatus Pelethosoma merdigallinarum]